MRHCDRHDASAHSSFQFLNGLAAASSLFLVAAGLSLIFGVTRIVNFAHGSLYMLGTYIAYSRSPPVRRRARLLGRRRRWPRSSSACIGALIEVLLLRRIYTRPNCCSCSPPSRWC